MTETKFFPLIDEFGQYRHADWPGKTHGVSQLADKKRRGRRPGAPSRSSGVGHLRRMESGTATRGHRPLSRREARRQLVAGRSGRPAVLVARHRLRRHELVHNADHRPPAVVCQPARQGFAAGQVLRRGHWGPHNYYEGKSYETYNFTAANLLRKYGDDWSRQFHDLVHRRLRSWGMNTIGNWSEASIYRMRKTPYVVTIHSGGRTLEGSQGYWGKFADVFDPGFAQSIRGRRLPGIRPPRPTILGAWATLSTTN